MTDALLAIDRALDGLCPCGADPAPGSAYCGDDCTPTHRSIHTTSDTDGTQMRWRPDLVTAVDDTLLTDLGSNTFYEGRHHARLFERNPSTWHLRLDDGHRFVGADLHDVPDILDAAFAQRVVDKWAALERELGNSRHLEVDEDPWADDWRLTDDEVRTISAPDFAERMDRFLTMAQGVLSSQRALRNGGFDTRLAGGVFDNRHAAPPRAGRRVHHEVEIGGTEGEPLLNVLVAAESEAALRERARSLAPANELLWWVPPATDARSILRNFTVT
jgi:hypothetical protein